MARERSGEAWRGVSPRLGLALEDRLAHGKGACGVALGPGFRELVDRHIRVRRHERLDLTLADRLVPCPRGDLVHLGLQRAEIVADELDEGGDGLRLGARTALLELVGDPPLQLSLGDVVAQHSPGFLGCLPECRARLELLGDEGENRRGSGAREVAGDRVDVGRLPAAPASTVCLHPVDVGNDDEPCVAEQASGVAEADHRLAWGVERRDGLDRLDLEMAAQACDRRLDLRAVAPGDEVDRLVGSVSHVRHTSAPFERSGAGRRIRRRRVRLRRFDRARGPVHSRAQRRSRPAGVRNRCSGRTR